MATCLPSCFFSPSGKRRFRFGRRGSPCAALRRALEFDIKGENLNGVGLAPKDHRYSPLALPSHCTSHRAFFFLEAVNSLDSNVYIIGANVRGSGFGCKRRNGLCIYPVISDRCRFANYALISAGIVLNGQM